MTRKRQERQHEQEQMAKAKRFCERKLWYVLAKILTLFSTEFFMLTQLIGLRDLDPILKVIISQKIACLHSISPTAGWSSTKFAWKSRIKLCFHKSVHYS